uniref:TANK binding kinase 1 ubiquitin-like domain-containing protein n=1 Tax=Glossina palpalis gambiensis TaxID=67801 RepID=A0A1B0BV06_9MUSC
MEIFLEPEELIEHFRERILMQTKVPMERQILLFNNEHLEKKLLPTPLAFPATYTENPIILCSNDENTFAQKYQQVKKNTVTCDVGGGVGDRAVSSGSGSNDIEEANELSQLLSY